MSQTLPIFCDDCKGLVDAGDFGLGAPYCSCSPGPLVEVAAERRAQEARWGVQNHPDVFGEVHATEIEDAEIHLDYIRDTVDRDHEQGTGDFFGILHEEFLEVRVEALKGDKAALRTELIQVAAVAVAWVEKLDREAN